jgi:hypothetical protein
MRIPVPSPSTPSTSPVVLSSIPLVEVTLSGDKPILPYRFGTN